MVLAAHLALGTPQRRASERYSVVRSAPLPGFGYPLRFMRTYRTVGLIVASVAATIVVGSWAVGCWQTSALVAEIGAATSPGEIAEAVAGKSLKELPERAQSRVLDALRTLVGKADYWREYHDGSPHRLFRWNSDTTRWVLVVTYEGRNVPDVSWMAIHLFDANWRQTAVLNFPTGYRIALFDVWKEQVSALAEPTITVRLGSVGSFGDFSYRQRQYYVLREARVALVRIEEEGGEVERGVFSSDHPFTGPRPPE